MERLAEFPPIKWALTHPRIAAWIVLSVGMVVLLVIEARDVGLSTTNWISLIVATILVAGACIWIVSWEDVDETDPIAASEATEKPPADAESNTNDDNKTTTSTAT